MLNSERINTLRELLEEASNLIMEQDGLIYRLDPNTLGRYDLLKKAKRFKAKMAEKYIVEVINAD